MVLWFGVWPKDKHDLIKDLKVAKVLNEISSFFVHGYPSRKMALARHCMVLVSRYRTPEPSGLTAFVCRLILLVNANTWLDIAENWLSFFETGNFDLCVDACARPIIFLRGEIIITLLCQFRSHTSYWQTKIHWENDAIYSYFKKRWYWI